MVWAPKFRLYAVDGITLIYTFPIVQYTNAPQTVNKKTVIEGIRGQGCIVVPGAESSWDLEIHGVLLIPNYDYTALATLIDTLETSVVMFTNYILVFDKSPSTAYTYNVQRLEPIEYNESLRTNYQEYRIKLRVGAW
jgi:hypothetical protein